MTMNEIYRATLRMGVQEPSSGVGEGILKIHNDLMVLLVAVVVLVVYVLARIVGVYRASRLVKREDVLHATALEVLWTVIPGVLLCLVGVPSITLLYAMEEEVDCPVTIKVVGHQWYWSYEYQNTESSIEFDSYMVEEADLEIGELRLLEVDNRIYLPVRTHCRLVITSGDVLHSWTIPSIGVKVDACPGRLNMASVIVKREGVYYGQCSELCGVNHGYMPIVVEVLSLEAYSEACDYMWEAE